VNREDRLCRDLDFVLDRAVSEQRIIGTVTLVMHQGALVYSAARGFTDRETGRAMTTDAIFLLASATKPITSAAAMALIERGVFGLETPVTDHLPEFRPRFEGHAPEITVRHLLTHTSGLYYPFQEPEDGPMHREEVSSGLDLPGLSGPEAMARLARVPLRFLPGTAYNYSLGLDVLGEFMTAASGKSLPEIVEETVTKPLGMDDTAFAVRDPLRLVNHYGIDAARKPVRMGETYWGPTLVSPARMSPRRLFDSKSYASGGGGMAGTATDFLAFIEALRRGDGSVLSGTSVALMTHKALPAHIHQALEPGWTYGLGTETLSDPARAIGPERRGAFKGSGGYGHRWFVDPALELTAVILTNSAPEGVRGAFVDETRNAIYAALELSPDGGSHHCGSQPST
jgi:CubicO group peptidase (beta-lactamase class C family)